MPFNAKFDENSIFFLQSVHNLNVVTTIKLSSVFIRFKYPQNIRKL